MQMITKERIIGLGREANNMSSVLVQFRTEETAKAMASSICDRLGLDLQSYLRMCISRMNQENGIPFSMNVNDIPRNRGMEAMLFTAKV